MSSLMMLATKKKLGDLLEGDWQERLAYIAETMRDKAMRGFVKRNGDDDGDNPDRRQINHVSVQCLNSVPDCRRPCPIDACEGTKSEMTLADLR